MDTKKHPVKKWEVSIMELQNRIGKKFKVYFYDLGIRNSPDVWGYFFGVARALLLGLDIRFVMVIYILAIAA